MAKTTFSSGTIVLSAWLNSIFNANGGEGHRHDSQTEDGSCEKINLAAGAEVKGKLPPSLINGDLDAIGVDVSSTYFTTPVTNETWHWTKIGPLVCLRTTQVIGSHASNTRVVFTPNSGNWPDGFLSNSSQTKLCCIVSNNIGMVGTIYIPTDPEGPLELQAPDSSGLLNTANFDISNKGIEEQTILWIIG